jgi:hypothetical protein
MQDFLLTSRPRTRGGVPETTVGWPGTRSRVARVAAAARGWHDQLMGMGPITIFDKSALQALSIDEAVWFDSFFLANVVPVFYVETLADLEKDTAAGKDPEALVGMLAEKTPSGAAPNVYHRHLILGELSGGQIEMGLGQIIIGAGDVKQAPDGSVGVHVDEFPEEAALHRWQNHEFLEIERAAAKGWRVELAAHDPDLLVGVLKNILPTETKISNLEQLKEFIDGFCASSDPAVITLCFEILGVPEIYKRAALKRWELAGRPPLDQFLPYTTHVFKVDLLFYLGIYRSFISGERASNRADIAYLYYLPFCMVFFSGDKLHKRTVPLFLRDNQSYVDVQELKPALREIDEHYDALPEEIKALGVMQFASYPPSAMDNAVTQLWDKQMRPGWRENAAEREAELGEPRDTAGGRQTAAEFRERIEQAQPLAAPPASGVDGPDYVVIRRQVPVRKGKWRMVSKEVEDADSED